MAETLRSVGLDVGTTSTQMLLSELTIENRASSFAVPDMEITRREILYQSPVHFTPLSDPTHIDAAALKDLVAREYAAAGISPAQVDSGAVIITGETARKDNARAVLDALSEFAGDFVVSVAGPDLESILAARGAGAVEDSAETGRTVLHMDIGGGTSNLAWITDGRIQAVSCLDVGGRLVRVDDRKRICYLSPVLSGLTELRVGDPVDEARLMPLARTLTHALEAAAGLRDAPELTARLATPGATPLWQTPPEGAVLSFSGGVADCIAARPDWDAFGDMGPVLGRAIAESALCRGEFRLPGQAIRATVIGAGCHSAQLSGSTVFVRSAPLPMKNLPAVRLSPGEQTLPIEALASCIRRKIGDQSPAVLSLPGFPAPDYGRIRQLAQAIAQGFGQNPVLVCLEQDMAKALGQALALLLPPDRCCLCIDRIRLEEGAILDVGEPVGPALPVVVKTLILSR